MAPSGTSVSVIPAVAAVQVLVECGKREPKQGHLARLADQFAGTQFS